MKATLPTSITKAPEFKYTYDDYLTDLIYKLRVSRGVAKENVMKSKDKNKNYYDKKVKEHKYAIGDQVYLKVEQFTKSKKLSPQYKGLYKIIEIISKSNVKIIQNRKHVVAHIDKLKPAFTKI